MGASKPETITEELRARRLGSKQATCAAKKAAEEKHSYARQVLAEECWPKPACCPELFKALAAEHAKHRIKFWNKKRWSCRFR